MLKAVAKHKNKYDYTKSDFTKNKIEILCRKHNVYFIQNISSHLKYEGCPVCRRESRMVSRETLISKFKKKHGNRYGYGDVTSSCLNDYVSITCYKHGIFKQKASHHALGQGCMECYRESRRKNTTKSLFSKQSRIKIFSKIREKYPSLNVDINDLIGLDFKTKFHCPEHGDFYKTPHALLRPGSNGCKICNRDSAHNIDNFIKKSRDIYGNTLRYKTIIRSKNFGTFVCLKHNYEFSQKLSDHLVRTKCIYCWKERSTMDTSEFITKAIGTHGNTYNYGKTKYEHSHRPVIVVCHKHGEFRILPYDHLRGRGCNICTSSMYEQIMVKLLRKHNVDFVREYRIEDYSFRYDFYIPTYNLLIELDGPLHRLNQYTMDMSIDEIIERDEIKKKIALDNGYRLLRINLDTRSPSKAEELIEKKLKIFR